MMATKTCSKCGEAKTREEFPSHSKNRDGLGCWCKLCHYNHTKKWRKTGRGQLSERKRKLKKYGLTIESFDALWTSQGGVCPICNGVLARVGNKYGVDHDHKTGKVRGILCDKCNVGLGSFKDNPEFLHKAAAYLAVKQ